MKEIKKPEWLRTVDMIIMGILASVVLVLWTVFLLRLGFAFWNYLGRWI